MIILILNSLNKLVATARKDLLQKCVLQLQLQLLLICHN